ncbi:MAG TPA: hypothetical protein VIB49_03615 [Thermoplasmata archaeon]
MDETGARRSLRAVASLHLSPRTLALVGSIVLASVIPRLLWDRFLDPFEDGYQNWWIGSVLAQTGQYTDLYSGMTRGNWLPGYHVFLAGLITGFGSHIMPLLKGVNILFSLGTAAAVYFIARPRGRNVATLAAVLFVLSPADIVITSFATPESLSLLATFAGVLFLERKPFGAGRSMALASLAFLVASTLRYEVWGFLLIYFAWKWAAREVTSRNLAMLAGPAVAFMAGWWAWTSPNGFLPAIIVGQTSADVRYKEAIGTLAPFWTRILAFFQFYLYYAPIAILAMIWAAKREIRSPFSLILFMFYGAEVAYTAAGFGNPSPRYIHLTTPIVAIYGGAALVAVGSWLRSAVARSRKSLGAAPTVAVLAISLLLVAQVVNPSPPPGTLLQGMERAGLFLSTRPLPPGKLVIAESPVAAYYSGYPASRIIGSTFLPADSSNATAFLVREIAYVVMVTVPYYRLRALFPDQANGTNGNHLVLLYDATGPEYSLGAPRVLVYEVVP